MLLTMFVTSRTQITNSSYCFTSILSQHRSHKACDRTFRFELDLLAVIDTQGIPSHQGFHQQTRTLEKMSKIQTSFYLVFTWIFPGFQVKSKFGESAISPSLVYQEISTVG